MCCHRGWETGTPGFFVLKGFSRVVLLVTPVLYFLNLVPSSPGVFDPKRELPRVRK